MLCPGFVKTDLMVKEPHGDGRRHVAQLDDRRDAARRRRDRDAGERVADQVLDAIVAERFWILTHEDMRHAPVERMERAEAQINPPMFGAG